MMPQAADMGGYPPEIQVPGDPAAPETPVDHLRAAIEHAQAALQAEPDDADSQQLARVVQGLYQILAQRQKSRDQAMGMQSSVRRAIQGLGG